MLFLHGFSLSIYGSESSVTVRCLPMPLPKLLAGFGKLAPQISKTHQLVWREDLPHGQFICESRPSKCRLRFLNLFQPRRDLIFVHNVGIDRFVERSIGIAEPPHRSFHLWTPFLIDLL